MAARDFIRNRPATVDNIKWRYCNMDKHRKDLMLQILNWGWILCIKGSRVPEWNTVLLWVADT